MIASKCQIQSSARKTGSKGKTEDVKVKFFKTSE